VPPDAPTHVYRSLRLPEIWREGAAERLAYLPASVLEVPPLAFGEADFSHPAIVESPPQGPGGVQLRHPPVDAYVLRDALVHGQYGVVTCGDRVVAESTAHIPLRRIAGAEWLDAAHERLRLPEQMLAGTLPAVYHLLTCNLDNYFHWMLEGLARFDAAVVRGIGVLGDAGREFWPLLPPLNTAWKQQSAALVVPPEQRQLGLPDGTSVRAGRLLYIEEFGGAGWHPHRALLTVFERMRAAGFASPRAEPSVPWRRLFVSRADSGNRTLVNEAEVFARASAEGFQRVVLDGMAVAEQARLFAEATHIIAPHGAGLTNLMFCRPGAALCELHMDCYVHWAFRGLAALRGVRYGCLIGDHIPPRREWAHHNSWRLDPARLDALLADPRFIAG
jgi:capsular polysaccharide biosynthesis protein